jgi:mono/diheme cytochrome c family protein
MSAARNKSRFFIVSAFALLPACGGSSGTGSSNALDPMLVQQGMDVFRNDTFGDEALWTGTLHLNDVIATVPPTTALAVGLKVDADAVPADVLASADLTSPATTIALIKLGAVVGVKGTVVNNGGTDQLMSIGITCAICHSTVDNSVTAGVGHRLDGWPNRDLNPGAIIALSPALTADQKSVYNSWGPGRYDPRYNQDGMNGPVLIPPAYGLKDSPHITYTGDGDIRYWNNYVAVTQMGGQGPFVDSRVGINKTLPSGTPDLVTPKLDALRAYQFSIDAPAPPAAMAPDATAASRGGNVFQQHCATCHAGTARTQDQLHAPADTGMDPVYAERSASKKYRTTPLRGLWQHPPYFHDGSAATLNDVVDHYDQTLSLGLSASDKSDLVAYLGSI